MALTEFEKLLLELAPVSFLLHYTTEKKWIKIQQEGLVPQPQESTRVDDFAKDLGIHIPSCVTWLGRDPAEATIDKDKSPIIIALPINYKKFKLQETIPDDEYITEKHIIPKYFLGFFDFTQYQEASQEERAFINWLEKMEKKTSDLTQ